MVTLLRPGAAFSIRSQISIFWQGTWFFVIIFVQVVAIEQNYEMDNKRKNEAMEARKEWLEESEKPDFAARGASYWQKRVATLMSPISMLWTLYSPLVKMFVLIIRLNAVFFIFLPHPRPPYPRHNYPWHKNPRHTRRHPRHDESRHAIPVKTCPGKTHVFVQGVF